MQKEAVCQPKFWEGATSLKVTLGQFVATLTRRWFLGKTFLHRFTVKRTFVEAFECVAVSGETGYYSRGECSGLSLSTNPYPFLRVATTEAEQRRVTLNCD